MPDPVIPPIVNPVVFPVAAVSDLYQIGKEWPFEQARGLLERLRRISGGLERPVIFETGYGPSGLPHIGTFGEVVRTSMVRHAFRELTNDQIPTSLIAFSDDLDGLRKIPPNVPNGESLRPHLGKPLTDIPDPFGLYPSFAHHNNARLRAFLDGFGFQYEFLSSTECYRAGRFNDMLLRLLERFDAVMAIMLPTLGPERAQTYSPFLPISPKSGRVLQVPTLERNVAKGTLVFADEDGEKTEISVLDGKVKIQWKPDWALRWAALGVDYEMAGKDLIDSVKVSSQICKVLGATPPAGFNYELFLDDRGEKISKTRGNGITVEEWLRYATPESLALFMFQKPKTAKRLYFDVIPKAVDDYYQHLAAFARQDEAQRIENPVWHIHAGKVPDFDMPISFALLLNLVSAANAGSSETLWGFVSRYAPELSAITHPALDQLVQRAIHYYEDFIRPHKKFRAPDAREEAAMRDLARALRDLPAHERDADKIQTVIFEIGKQHGFDPLRNWFQALYEVLLGQSQGPRFGSFVAIFGVEESCALIDKALAREAI